MNKEVEVTGTLKIADKLDIIELLVRQVSALLAHRMSSCPAR